MLALQLTHAEKDLIDLLVTLRDRLGLRLRCCGGSLAADAIFFHHLLRHTAILHLNEQALEFSRELVVLSKWKNAASGVELRACCDDGRFGRVVIANVDELVRAFDRGICSDACALLQKTEVILRLIQQRCLIELRLRLLNHLNRLRVARRCHLNLRPRCNCVVPIGLRGERLRGCAEFINGWTSWNWRRWWFNWCWRWLDGRLWHWFGSWLARCWLRWWILHCYGCVYSRQRDRSHEHDGHEACERACCGNSAQTCLNDHRRNQLESLHAVLLVNKVRSIRALLRQFAIDSAR